MSVKRVDCIKGAPFLSIMAYKRVRGWTRERDKAIIRGILKLFFKKTKKGEGKIFDGKKGGVMPMFSDAIERLSTGICNIWQEPIKTKYHV